MTRPRPDVVLINPRSRTQVYQGLGTDLAAIENPVWAGLMATFVRRQGLTAEIIDAEADELAPAEVAQRVAELDPILNVVVVYGHQPSASTQIMPASGAVARALKETAPEQKVLMVGGHVAALPGRTLEEEACDYVGAGEGLFTIVDLVRALKASPSHPELSKVRGLWYRENGAMNFTPHAPLVQNVDVEMPGIAWDLLPMRKYRAHNWHCFDDLKRQPYAAIYTTLGCPYHCTFCCIQAPFKSGEKELGLKETANSYRYWSPKLVGDELEKLAKMGVRNIKIADEMFVLNKKHVLGICDEIIARGLDFNIWAYARIDTVKEGMLPRLREAGFNWLAFGIEAANSRVQADVDKRFDEEDVYETVAKVKAAGINIIGNFIFGLPEDDRASMQETLDMALKLNCEFANLYSAMAYPGSPLYNMALAQGWELPEKWSGYSQHSVDSKPLRTKYLSSAEVLSFRDEAFQRYFTAPGYLDMVRARFGQETVDHIRQMTAHKLVRQAVVAQPAA
ncbi:MAG: B12-binding domain-containing radical SAM protein [Deltaproteobacteria bacterium]